MNEIVEREVKYLLSQGIYEKFNQLFPWTKSYWQVNHYYSPKDKIHSKMTIRIRQVDCDLRLEIKHILSKEPRIAKEYSKIVDKIKYNILCNEIYEISGIKCDAVYYIGDLITFRKEYEYSEGVKICLDQSFYIGKIDYELEIEYVSKYPIDLVEKIENIYGVTIQHKGKYTRFIENYNTLYKENVLSSIKMKK